MAGRQVEWPAEAHTGFWWRKLKGINFEDWKIFKLILQGCGQEKVENIQIDLTRKTREDVDRIDLA
jgi:hypothetical protein